jgi:thiamine pyrophosphate-dependent acetolactate synthase large subunit-like protein
MRMPDTTNSMEQPVNAGQFEMSWGSDAVAQMLREFGIDYIALNPGASYRGLHDSLVNYLGNRDPKMLVALHEEHAVAIAHGYAKVTDKPMAVAVHSNVGLMHATMAIFNAWCDRVPMLILGATGPMDADKRRPWIEWIHTAKDQGALVRDYIKWDDQPASPEAAVESMLRAWQITRTKPNAPVYVCLDLGMQEQKLDAPLDIPDPARFEPGAPFAPAAESVEQAVELLAAAKKPLILVGRTSRSHAAWDERVRLAELLDARVLTDLKTGAAFPTSHPLHPAPPMKRPDGSAKTMIAEADVILSLDWIDPAGTFKLATGKSEIDGKLINASLDSLLHNGWSMDHHILPAVDVRILSDPDSTVSAILPALEAKLDGVVKKTNWPQPVSDLTPLPEVKPADAPLEHRDLADAMKAALAGRSSTLMRIPLTWPGSICQFDEPLDFLGGDGAAGIGSGPGMSVGSALALKGSGRIPVAILGDGDTLMGLNGLWTAAKYRIPLLVLVSNNRSYYNDVVHQETVAHLRGRPPENRLVGQRIEGPTPDLAKLARGLGWKAEGPIITKGALMDVLTKAVEEVAEGACWLVDAHILRK